jgi:hypothetical protein
MTRKIKPRFLVPDDDDTADAVDRADGIQYLPIDEATAVATPDTIDQAWHDLEYDELAAEQKPRWAARGEKLARPFVVLAQRWRCRRDADCHAIEAQQIIVDGEKGRLELTEQALHGYTRREPHAKGMYLLRWTLLLLGDIAGIAGAAVLLGEIPYLALLQAVSSAIAAVTAGLVGNDIRDARLARRRASDTKTMPAEHQQFAWLFSGADVGEKIVRAMIGAAIAVTLLIGAGIYTLRTGVEGSLGGVVFGCLAVAICLASALNSYTYADEIADLLDHAYARYTRALRKLARLARSKAVARYDAATAEAESIKTEHEHLGIAGERKILALKHGISRNNPAVLGHGPAKTETSTQPAQPDLFSALELSLNDRTAKPRTANGSRP